jgi:hypothetical protein
MFTATFSTPQMAQFVADLIRPYGVSNPYLDGATIKIDDEALEVLAELDSETDGHYDGEHIWVGGSEYPVVRLGRARAGKTITVRFDPRILTDLSVRAAELGIPRTDLIRRYVNEGLVTTIGLGVLREDATGRVLRVYRNAGYYGTVFACGACEIYDVALRDVTSADDPISAAEEWIAGIAGWHAGEATGRGAKAIGEQTINGWTEGGWSELQSALGYFIRARKARIDGKKLDLLPMAA